MANKEHLAIIEKGVGAWNKWRAENSEIQPDLSDANLVGAKLKGMDLSGADLRNAHLNGVNLVDANFSQADLSYANLSKANLCDTSFSCTNLSKANLGEALLFRSDLSYADLRYANLSKANLREAGLSNANLREADLGQADLTVADLDFADLTGANLRGVNFHSADLNYANLICANLQWSNLLHAILSRTNLQGADFTNACMYGTKFADTDLRQAIGLESVRHRGPSEISISTLYKSGGQIPESFLRGCGVPDEFITFLPSIIGVQQAVQFYSCFISYSTKDEEFAKRLHSRMRDNHLRVWFAPEDIKGGDKIHEQVERAIQVHDRLLIVLSEQSMKSEWVMTEIRNARQAEIREKRRKLFPIRLVDFDAIRKWKCFDADTGKDLAVELREYYIPDFSNWKEHNSFEKGFSRLLRDLKAEESN